MAKTNVLIDDVGNSELWKARKLMSANGIWRLPDAMRPGRKSDSVDMKSTIILTHGKLHNDASGEVLSWREQRSFS